MKILSRRPNLKNMSFPNFSTPNSDAVYLNGETYRLRDDGTVYLGMNTWYRPVGTVRWLDTDEYGRASLIVGARYDAITYPEGGVPPEAPPSFFEKLRRLLMSLL